MITMRSLVTVHLIMKLLQHFIDPILYAVYYIPMAYVLYNSMFIPCNPFYLFCALNTFPSGNHPLVSSIHEPVFIVLSLFCLYDFIREINGQRHLVG